MIESAKKKESSCHKKAINENANLHISEVECNLEQTAHLGLIEEVEN